MSTETTNSVGKTDKRPYAKKSKYWKSIKKKNAAKKKAAKKTTGHNQHDTFYHRPKKDLSVVDAANDIKSLVNVVKYAIDQMNTTDKAEVFAHILGTNNPDEKQLWAIEKLLNA